MNYHQPHHPCQSNYNKIRRKLGIGNSFKLSIDY